jgi:hypothetical protein
MIGGVEVNSDRCAGSVVAIGVKAFSNRIDSPANASRLGLVLRKYP